jgi:hypothetical protein
MGNMARGFLIKINEILGNDVEQNSEDLQKGAFIWTLINIIQAKFKQLRLAH